MSRIRSRGNKETELALAMLFRRHGITGWRRQREVRSPRSEVRSFRVRPDFVFPKLRLAVFVDGCFWHGCPIHSPPARWLRKSVMPRTPGPLRGKGSARTGKRFWREKLAANRVRDRKVNRALRAAGWRVLRVWEHELVKQNSARLVLRLSAAISGRSSLRLRRFSAAGHRTPAHSPARRGRYSSTGTTSRSMM
jgi:DNA mismatch endonuclease (patch repair protein)